MIYNSVYRNCLEFYDLIVNYKKNDIEFDKIF